MLLLCVTDQLLHGYNSCNHNWDLRSLTSDIMPWYLAISSGWRMMMAPTRNLNVTWLSTSKTEHSLILVGSNSIYTLLYFLHLENTFLLENSIHWSYVYYFVEHHVFWTVKQIQYFPISSLVHARWHKDNLGYDRKHF